jgi:hypothetical protein
MIIFLRNAWKFKFNFIKVLALFCQTLFHSDDDDNLVSYSLPITAFENIREIECSPSLPSPNFAKFCIRVINTNEKHCFFKMQYRDNYSVDRQWRLESIHNLRFGLIHSTPLDLSQYIPYYWGYGSNQKEGMDQVKTSLTVHTCYSMDKIKWHKQSKEQPRQSHDPFITLLLHIVLYSRYFCRFSGPSE